MLDLDLKRQLGSERLGDISYQWEQLQRRSDEETVQNNFSRCFFFLGPTTNTGSDATDRAAGACAEPSRVISYFQKQ